MLKLLKNMRRKEVLMVLLCTVLVAVQVYFDLRLGHRRFLAGGHVRPEP